MSAAYATLADLVVLGVSANALTGIATSAQQQAITGACDEADGYLASRYKLPLATWGQDLRGHVCAIAAYRLLAVRGYNPDDGADSVLRDRYDDAIKWLVRVAEEKVTPAGVTDAGSMPAAVGGAGPFVVQTSVEAQGSRPSYSLVAGGPPPSVQDRSPTGFLVTGPPKLRGW